MNIAKLFFKISPDLHGCKRALVALIIIAFNFTAYLQSQTVVIQEVIRGNAMVSSPTSVKMLPGFKAVAGSAFKAYIGSAQPASSTHDITVGSQSLVSPSATPGKNFVKTVTYREPKTAEPASDTSFKQITEIAYFDGLGRPVQNVSVATSPLGKDIIQAVLYDNMGREKYKPLPYAASESDGSFRPNVDQTTISTIYSSSAIAGIEANGRAYSEIVYENSPLNRVLSQTAPGTAWQNKPVTMDYLINDVEVQGWIVNETGGIESYPYGVGSLYIYETTDEEGNKTREYKDKQGQVVQKSSWINGQWLRTAYIYNNRNLLYCVIPPQASGPDSINLCYFYKYDERKRMTEKRIPGGGKILMVYDKRDRLRCTRNSLQTNEWSFIKYDELNRPVISGVIKNYNADTSTIRRTIENSAVQNETITNTSVYFSYNNASFPGSGLTTEVHTVSYYDNYSFIQNLNLQSVLSSSNYDETGYNIASKYDDTPVGMVTGTFTKVLSSDNYKAADTMLFAATYYDAKGMVLRSISENHLGGKDVITNVYEKITYAVLKSKQKHYAAGCETTLERKLRYDHTGRLLSTFVKVNNQQPFTLNSMVYNELGQLVTKYLHASDTTGTMNFLQKVDNQYNIRGWLTKINDPSLNGENDLFGMQLCYETTAALGGLDNTTGYYNGNLVGLKWSTREGSIQTKAYRFSYDALNRLKTSSYAEGNALNEKMGFFDENINEYDKNGNIKSLSRKFNNDLVDNLNYTYIPNTNQILSISDAGLSSGLVEDYPGTSGTYAYDANGNVVHDGSRSTTIDYFKTLNIPKSVDFGSDNQIFYHYSATGSKLVKHVQKPDGQEYVQYVGNIVYEEGKLSYIITEEGRLVNTGTTGSPAFVSEYYLKDHLGNTRVSFLGKTLPGNVIEVTGKTDYYPFGLAMSQYSTNITSDFSENKYLYNGKEIQDDKLNGTFFGWLDYGARFYDPQIGRFHTQDAFAEKYLNLSPYQYCANNPIRYIDINGDSIYIFGANGQFLFNLDNGSSEVTGLYFQNSKTDKKGNITLSDGVGFGFNDLESDRSGIKSGQTRVSLINDSQIDNAMNESGAANPGENRWNYIERESRPQGNESLLSGRSNGNLDFFGTNETGIINYGMLHIVRGKDNQGVAYNDQDFGNFLWGQAGRRLGFNLSTLRLAAHGNNAANSGTDNPGMEYHILDANSDQRAIRNGYYHNVKTQQNGAQPKIGLLQYNP